MNFSMHNNLNIWEWKEHNKWYRLDKKVTFLFRKIKWMFQRAKYGYCDRDLWDLDYTLGNYLASTINKLADINHGYPHDVTEKEWDDILKNMAYNFYVGTNEDFWEDPYNKFLSYEKNFNELDEKQKELWRKWFEKQEETSNLMKEHRHEGFQTLEKWYDYLWD